MSTELTTAEEERLARDEAVIEPGLRTFIEVGLALADVRDARLYRKTHDTFEDYAEHRWNLSRKRAYDLMSAARAVSPIGDSGLPLPANEGQARELARVPEEQRAEVWQQTLDRTGGKPTAAAIRATYEPPQTHSRPLQVEPIADYASDDDSPEEPTLLPDGPRYCKYCYGDHELDYGPDGSILVCTNCGSGLAPVDEANEAGGYDAFTEKIAEQFDAYLDAVADFPELKYYDMQPRKAIALADNLRQFTEPELTMRRENLAKAIAADQRRGAQPAEPAGPDYAKLTDEMFVAANHAAQVIARNGGPATLRQAIAATPPAMLNTWRDQFTDLARACSDLANECTPQLRRLK